MCVSAVTDEIIAAGSIVTEKKDGGIVVTINDENGYNVSENRYHYVNEWDEKTETQTMQFYRSYSNGELYKANLKLSLDTGSRYNPLIKATGIGQLTKTEVGELVNAIMWQEYVVTDTKEDKYGFLTSITFRDKEEVAADAIEAERQARFTAKREAKKLEMAAQLIG